MYLDSIREINSLYIKLICCMLRMFFGSCFYVEEKSVLIVYFSFLHVVVDGYKRPTQQINALSRTVPGGT